MKINRYRNTFEGFFRDVPARSPGKSLLAGARAEMYQIAACYRDDGDRFLHAGDDINALASYAYASGWIDTGFFLGVFPCGSPCGLLFEDEELRPDLSNSLREKATRYGRILATACSSCRPFLSPGSHGTMGESALFSLLLHTCTGGHGFSRTTA